MKTLRIVSVMVMAVIIAAILLPAIAVAQDETVTTSGPDTIKLSTTYPTLEALSTATFQFTVDLFYTGAQDRVFDLKATPPQGWSISVTPLYETSKIISSVSMAGSETGRTQNLQISTGGTYYDPPAPGDYTIIFEARSGDLAATIELKARVTAKYSLMADTADGLYSLRAKGGKESVFSLVVTNTGSAPVENIAFTSDKTQGWEITFSQDKIAALEAGAKSTVDVKIKPAAKTVSGDYMVNIWINGKQASAPDKIAMRVTVETTSLWGWVGIIIILVVVAGLVYIFMKFGRR